MNRGNLDHRVKFTTDQRELEYRLMYIRIREEIDPVNVLKKEKEEEEEERERKRENPVNVLMKREEEGGPVNVLMANEGREGNLAKEEVAKGRAGKGRAEGRAVTERGERGVLRVKNVAPEEENLAMNVIPL